MTITATGAQITRLTDRIGARLTGLDLTGDLDEHTVATLREALLAHKALVIPNTPLDLEGQYRLTAVEAIDVLEGWTVRGFLDPARRDAVPTPTSPSDPGAESPEVTRTDDAREPLA